jgi:hypothetical protein
MTVAASDIKYYLSGGGTNADPGASLGGAISSVQAGTDLFDNVLAAEASAGDVEYRLLYVKNTHATDTLYAAKAWVPTNTPSTYSSVKIALCDEGASATAETVATEGTAPTGPVFAEAATVGAALSLGNLGPGAYYGIWVERTITAGAPAYANDTFTLRVTGDTSA